jgi:hypothetical protein
MLRLLVKVVSVRQLVPPTRCCDIATRKVLPTLPAEHEGRSEPVPLKLVHFYALLLHLP